MTKRTRADSASSAVKAMFDAAKPLPEPPSHVMMTDEAKVYWNDVIRARARDEWTELDLVIGAQLANCMADIAEQDAFLRVEGMIVENQRGTQIMNPRATVMERLAAREMALMRTLRMGGKVAGDPRDELGKRSIQRQSAKIREELEEDDLLAS
jgi:hypothetical protein